jgi:glutamate racemase
VEKVAEITRNGHIGVLGTVGTVVSESYPIELQKWSGGKVKSTVQEACPMWVPIVENNEIGTEGAEYFIKKNIQNILRKDAKLDTLILGCTHYPLLLETIRKYVPENIHILEQGEIVATKLIEYLERHPEMDSRLSKDSVTEFLTTESSENFENKAELFLGTSVSAATIHL